jgi:hypothetical protein
MYKFMPIPKFSEEDYRQAEKEYAGKTKSEKPVSSLPEGQRPRSLHYIDDEDESDEQPKVANNTHKGTRFDYDDDSVADEGKAAVEKKLSVERATIKEDDKNQTESKHKKKFDKKDKK